MQNKNFKMTQSVIPAEAGIQNRGSRIRCGMTAVVLITFFIGIFVAQAISIAPLMIDFRANPGETREFKIKIKNDETNQICFKLDIVAINKMNADGSPIFDTEAASAAMASWFSLKEKNICAKPGEIINPTLVIAIPNTVRTAGIYAVAYFTPIINAQNKEGATVINRVGTLIAIRLDQIIAVEQGKITQFTYDETNKKFLVDFVNEGNIHLRPYGEITIKNKAGATLETIPFNEVGALVLPESARHFEIFWDNRLSQKSLATLRILYGTGPKMASATIELKAQVPKNETNTRLSMIVFLALGAIVLGYAIKKIRRSYV